MTDPELVYRWRKRLGLTQAQAGEVVGVTRCQWWRYEAGVKGGRFPKRAWRLLLERLVEGE